MINSIFNFFKRIIEHVVNFKISDICAQTSFYFVLSFFPFLIIFVFLISLMPFETSHLFNFVDQSVPSYLQPIIIDDFSNYYLNLNFSLLSISFVISIFSASSITSAFLKLLNEIYNHTETRSFVKNRVLSIAVNFGFISLAMAFFVFVILLSSIINLLSTTLNVHLPLFSSLINYFIVPTFMFCVIMIIYKVSDFNKNKLRKYFIGAFVATILLFISFYLLNIYFIYFSSYLKYGMIGAFIVLLLYFYFVSFIIFLGAIINKVLFFENN